MVAEMFLSWLGMDYWVSILSNNAGLSFGMMQQPLQPWIHTIGMEAKLEPEINSRGVGEMVDYRL